MQQVQSRSVAGVVLLTLALLPYGLMVAVLLDAPDATGGGGEARIAAAFAAVAGLLGWAGVWGLLGIALLLGWKAGGFGGRTGIVVLVLAPMAAFVAALAIIRAFDEPGRWALLVPMLLPIPVAVLALRACLPVAAVAGSAVTNGLLAVVAALTVSIVPLAALDQAQAPARRARASEQLRETVARLQAEAEAEKRADAARFAAIGPGSSLRDLLHDLYSGDADRHELALAKARQIASRQEDATALLAEDKLWLLPDLWQIGLAPTQAFCAAYAAALVREAKPDRPEPPLNVAEELERQLPNLRWLAASGCDVSGAARAVQVWVRRVTDGLGPEDGGRPRWVAADAALTAVQGVR